MARNSWIFITLLVAILLPACTPAASTGPVAPLAATAHPSDVTDHQPALSTPLASPLASPSASLPASLTAPPAAARPASPTGPAPGPAAILPTAPGPATTRASGPTPTATPLACLAQGGRIETGSLDTSLLTKPLVYRVYLPPCYRQQPDRRYPVLYLFHGQSYNDDQWDRMGADETAGRLIAAGEIPPFLIVMPFERYGNQPTDTKFDQAVMEVLLPYIEGAYRTIPDRQHRAVGGLSRGAGWAVHFGIWQAGEFSAIGAHSPAVFHSDAQRMRTWLKDLAPGGYPRIYIDIGERDRPEILRSADWFVKLLDEFDVPHDWHLFTGYHNEEYWTSHMEQYLRWYSADW